VESCWLLLLSNFSRRTDSRGYYALRSLTDHHFGTIVGLTLKGVNIPAATAVWLVGMPYVWDLRTQT
jgi:hypothetical protein